MQTRQSLKEVFSKQITGSVNWIIRVLHIQRLQIVDNTEQPIKAR